MRRILTLCAVTCTLSCANAEPDDRSSIEQLPRTEDEPQDTIGAILAARQRALLRALTDPAGDAVPYLATNFTMSDWNAPRDSTARSWTAPYGRSPFGLDYFKALAAQLTPLRAEITELEIQPSYGGEFLVIAHHAAVSPTITRWQHTADGWKALTLGINTPAEVVARVRQARTDVIIRAQQRGRADSGRAR